ncbi:MAG: imidazole glycerol phosphate synthase subunit HisH [Gemmatimonadota bacterium]|nr:imidazole glycerol phosphate synthase subunit HisH [Gemmatimonadota bacterium]
MGGSREPIRLVPTGIANLEAVAAAFRRLGREVEIAGSPRVILEAGHLVLPGVGSFASGVDALDDAGWAEPLRERVQEGRPTLAICLGLQLLCESSAEAPGVAGLGCIPGTVTRFGDDVRVPQLGWNAVRANGDARYLKSSVMYFANSYRLESPPPGWAVATARHGGTFVAALERDGVLACQFHPELSGTAGQGLLSSWLERSRC